MRSVELWEGATDDTPVPARVKLRILQAQNRQCPNCRQPFDAKRKPEFDHHFALINGGRNWEPNIVALCGPCHAVKTGADVAEKSKVARISKKHLGLKPKSRGFQKPDPKKWRQIAFGQYERIPHD